MTTLTLGKIAALGGMIPIEPVKKSIKFSCPDPETGEIVDNEADIFVVRIAVAEYEKLAVMQTAEKKEDRHYMAATIATAVRLGEKGNELIALETALRFDPAMATAMIHAVNEVNGLAKKRLPPTTSFGSKSSRRGLAAVRSAKRNKT